MASNGLYSKAKKGTCRICQRIRNTDKQVKAVGEVHHGFATGHIWECVDTEDCDKVAIEKLADNNVGTVIHARIRISLQQGRFYEYRIVS